MAKKIIYNSAYGLFLPCHDLAVFGLFDCKLYLHSPFEGAILTMWHYVIRNYTEQMNGSVLYKINCSLSNVLSCSVPDDIR